MRLFDRFLGLGLIGLLCASCVKDTCNGALGNTFNSIEVDSLSSTADDNLMLHLKVSTLPDLPENYFEEAYAIDSATENQTQSFSATKTHMRLDLDPAVIPLYNETIHLNYNFLFGDRRNYIDCQHPGSSDSYYLEMSFTLTNSAGTGNTISNFEWNEIFAAGHL